MNEGQQEVPAGAPVEGGMVGSGPLGLSTAQECADALSVSRANLDRWRTKGVIVCHVIAGRRWYATPEVERALRWHLGLGARGARPLTLTGAEREELEAWAAYASDEAPAVVRRVAGWALSTATTVPT